MRKRTIEVFIHVAGCIIFLALPILFRPGSLENFDIFDDPRSRSDIISYLLLILFFYANSYVLIPKLQFEKKYLRFAAAVFFCFLIVAYLPDAFVSFDHPRRPPPPKPPGGGFIFFRISNVLFLFLIVFFFSLVLKISDRWKRTEKEKLQAELSYLKAQINPHFLFNTLNGIYALAIQGSEHTASAVVKLAGMMRYVMYEAHHEYVSLEKEITYIKSYIELQKIRFGDSIDVTFSVQGDIRSKTMAPLILISFVENAFKHGVNAEQDSRIVIRLDIVEDTLYLEVSNKKVLPMQLDDEKSGLGIENASGRLTALYGGKHSLSIQDNERDFIVSLKLMLA